ncbi:M23 family metallopeptidase [Brevibacillus fulvus]|uniref:Murein DD-endopeptidase MepM/ murein hydrolase activator NlpD n=1 Tax=Brevibacillus fulvus TaxID=1125967 RepID=A0A939BP94_9BACL|nr:M23 family metallopeptidase [Brevibacillus fulvus]MBM7590205.1 murein DD-endopeptidase MepM/ murein hydrolase activator NlpD [Brevibacillus fulvus]
MEIYDSDLPSNWSSQEEAKRSVVEQTLLQTFNPYAALQDTKPQNAVQNTVITYMVQPGDTLSEIAYKYGVDLKDLIEENRLNNPNMVGIGIKLNIRRNEIAHTVARDETLDSIARRYQVRKELLIDRNPLLRLMPDNLYVGQTVYVPLPVSRPLLAGNVQLRKQMAQLASRKATRSRTMDWPIDSPTITSGFGSRWGKMHKGLDLWNQAEEQTPIRAAREGTVVQAGANNGGYGFLVVLDHRDGLQTFYAHMRKISVYVGQIVNRGDVLGYMGNTGDSTGYHLHFEVRQDNVPVNPLRYLSR